MTAIESLRLCEAAIQELSIEDRAKVIAILDEIKNIYVMTGRQSEFLIAASLIIAQVVADQEMDMSRPKERKAGQ